MGKYLLTYYGGEMPQSEEEQARVMKAWEDWLGGLGSALVDPGNPTMPAKAIAADGTVSDDDPSSAVTGYTLIDADSMGAAIEMTKGCPQLASHNGAVKVHETVEM